MTDYQKGLLILGIWIACAATAWLLVIVCVMHPEILIFLAGIVLFLLWVRWDGERHRRRMEWVYDEHFVDLPNPYRERRGCSWMGDK